MARGIPASSEIRAIATAVLELNGGSVHRTARELAAVGLALPRRTFQDWSRKHSEALSDALLEHARAELIAGVELGIARYLAIITDARFIAELAGTRPAALAPTMATLIDKADLMWNRTAPTVDGPLEKLLIEIRDLLRAASDDKSAAA